MGKQRVQGRPRRQAPRQRPDRAAAREANLPRQRQAKSKPKAKPRTARGRTGWAGMRRSRGQKLGIAAAAAVVVAVIWLTVDWPLAIGLSALVLLLLPAIVVLTMGRRY